MKPYQEPKYDIIRGRVVNRDSGVKIPEYEPLFIFRAQDKHLPALLREYKKMCKDPNHKKVIQVRINQIVEFQRNNKKSVKEPDSSSVDLTKARVE